MMKAPEMLIPVVEVPLRPFSFDETMFLLISGEMAAALISGDVVRFTEKREELLQFASRHLFTERDALHLMKDQIIPLVVAGEKLRPKSGE